MKTTKVFIDTQAIYSAGFSYNGKILSAIGRLGRAERLELYITDIVIRELKKHLTEKTNEIVNTKRIRKAAGFLDPLPEIFVNAIAALEAVDFETTAHQQLDSYLKNSRINVLSTEEVKSKQLFDLYFAGSPPFGSGKKKNEFPDAASILALKAEISDGIIYAVSDDADFLKFCETDDTLISVKHLSELLDIYFSTNEPMSEAIHMYISENHARIFWLMSKEIENANFDFPDLCDAEVDNIIFRAGKILDSDIVDIQDDLATVAISLEALFNADVNGEDLTYAIWDKEDQRYYGSSTFSGTDIFKKIFDISIVLEVDPDDFDNIEIKSLELSEISDLVLSNDDIPFDWSTHIDNQSINKTEASQ